MQFTQEQIIELREIKNGDILIKIFKRMIYLSSLSYIEIVDDLKNDIGDMIDDITQ